MIHYVLAYACSLLFIFFMVYLCQSIGKKVSGNERFSINIIYGFVIYSAIQGVGGIIIQLLKLDFIYYQIYMIIILLVLLLYKSQLNKIRLKFISSMLLKHLKQYYLIYFVAGCLLFLSLIHIEGLWTSNRLDDGWYLIQIEQLPHLNLADSIHASTGFSYTPSFMRVVNTYEMEAAFYSHALNIPASIFVKVALSYFHYFLLVICVYELSFKMLKNKNLVVLCKYIPLVLLLLALSANMLRNGELLVLSDDWQFNSAMGYGSSVVRTMGIFLFLPIIDRKLFSGKTILYIIATSIALIVKGTQALPIIYLVIAALFILWVVDNLKGNKRIIVISVGIGALLLFPPIGEAFAVNAKAVYSIFYDNFNNSFMAVYIIIGGYLCLFIKPSFRNKVIDALPLMLILSLAVGNVLFSASLVFIYGFSIKNSYIKKWNYFLLISAALMFIPRINTLFINLSVFDFVVKRALTLYSIVLIITAFIYFAYYLSEIKLTTKKISLVYVAFALTFCSSYFIKFRNTYSFVHALAVLKNNPELIPASTIELSEKLDAIAVKQGKPVNVVMPVPYSIDGVPHYPYIMLRLHSLNVRNVSAMARYGQEESEQHDPIIRGYSYVEQTLIDVMNIGKTDLKKHKKALEEILKKYPVIDTFVVANHKFRNMLVEEFGFKEVDRVNISDAGVINYILQRNSKD